MGQVCGKGAKGGGKPQELALMYVDDAAGVTMPIPVSINASEPWSMVRQAVALEVDVPADVLLFRRAKSKVVIRDDFLVRDVKVKTTDTVLAVNNYDQWIKGKSVPWLKQYCESRPLVLDYIIRRQPSLAQEIADAPQQEPPLALPPSSQGVGIGRQLVNTSAGLVDADSKQGQHMIYESIRQENVARNLEHALEHNPKSFLAQEMLYLDLHVNTVPVRALVDTGAQSTVMNRDCAEACGLMHLLDTTFKGTAQGIGNARILGKVHSASVVLGGVSITASFNVLDGIPEAFLLGLDALRDFGCVIDLRNNVMQVQGYDIPFVSSQPAPDDDYESSGDNMQYGGNGHGYEYGQDGDDGMDDNDEEVNNAWEHMRSVQDQRRRMDESMYGGHDDNNEYGQNYM